jgi:hypothetical protein
VTTKRGLVAIDKICVGELVLSRNPETGETAYKPVLARTLKPRVPMTRLSAGGDALSATPGHFFWTDDGWKKARELKTHSTLVGADGTATLAAAEQTEPAQAYNLIVADFGTYFVGKNRILVHDATPIRDLPARVK